MKIVDQLSLRKSYFNRSIEAAAKSGMINVPLLSSTALYSEWLKNYLIWRLFPELFNDFSASERYLNMYYWLKGFYILYELKNGVDVGIEQQISALLLEISNSVIDFDWNQISEVDHKIENELNS